jgi:L-glyceraldehyde 3-phosphate reductase
MTDARRAALRALSEVARRRGQSLAQMALAWTLRHPEVTSVLMGASSVAQLEENAAAVKNLSFTDEELTEIDTLTQTPLSLWEGLLSLIVV